MQQLVDDLYRPFESLQVAQVVALRVASRIASDGVDRLSANRKTRLADCARTTGHSFTTAIAGAIAGAKQIGTWALEAVIETAMKQRLSSCVDAAVCSVWRGVDAEEGEEKAEGD